MKTSKKQKYSNGSACIGGSCAIDRRSLLKGAAAATGGMMVGGISGNAIFAQTPEGDLTPIPRLNGGGMGGGSNPQANFNAYSPNKISGTENFLFEKLIFVNQYNCEEVPWLAESYEWIDPQTLTFTIREGVLWNDGTPFTAEDVAFTFELINEHAALDLRGATVNFESVVADGNTVTLTYSQPSVPIFHPVVDTFIVPKHIWENFDDPVTEVNAENPVGTGPYTLANFNSEEVLWRKNEDYWQADQIVVQEIGFSKPAEGQADMLRLANGQYDWNAMYIPNVDDVYVSADPDHNHYWYPQGGLVALYFNLTKEPFSDVNFRRAVAMAINKDEIVQKAQLGYVTEASQSGLKVPGQLDWLSPDIPDDGVILYDPDGARALLEENGYSYDGDTLKDPEGNNVEFTFKVQAGWSDWVQAANIVASELGNVGMRVNVETPDPSILNDQDRPTGNFDLCFNVHGGGCSMYRNFADHMGSHVSAPVGERATSNFARWEDEETDALLSQFLSAQEEDEQISISHQLQNIMYEQFPTIPLWYGAHWFQYRTENAVGWPNEDDPYCGTGDLPLMLLRLRAPGDQ